MADNPSDVVRAFYRAVADRNGSALDALVEASFAPDAVVEWPRGLPYGGLVEGRDTLRKVFAALTRESSSPVGPENLQVAAVVDGGEHVAAQLTFDWRFGGSSIPSGALELWTFKSGLAAEVRAYYWDTAACAALVRSAQEPSA